MILGGGLHGLSYGNWDGVPVGEKSWSGLSWISENVKGGKKGKDSLSFPLEEGEELRDEDSISDASRCSML